MLLDRINSKAKPKITDPDSRVSEVFSGVNISQAFAYRQCLSGCNAKACEALL